MEHLVAIMILIGCNGPATCRTLPPPSDSYASLSHCEDALKNAILASTASAPEVHGTCREVDPAVFERDASVEWSLSEAGRVHVSVVDGDARRAADTSIIASR